MKTPSTDPMCRRYSIPKSPQHMYRFSAKIAAAGTKVVRRARMGFNKKRIPDAFDRAQAVPDRAQFLGVPVGPAEIGLHRTVSGRLPGDRKRRGLLRTALDFPRVYDSGRGF